MFKPQATGFYRRRRNITMAAALVLAIASSVYTYQNRYFLRFVPLPLAAADIVNRGNWLLPSHQPAAARGTVDLGGHDMLTEGGLRSLLNSIQQISPVEPASSPPDYADITFDKWLAEIASKPFFCTDATQLFILAAWKQGLAAREWQLLPPGWPPGIGHSVAEFFNPRTETWQLVDAQHAAIIRGADGQITNMTSLLRAFAEQRHADITVDYGPYREAMLNGARGASSEHYFFKSGLLATPVLQLGQPTWFASVRRKFGLSGHFVIGYPIIVHGWTHDDRVWLSKISALFGVGLWVMVGFGFLNGLKIAAPTPVKTD